jgi:hypothetical protein
METRNFDGGDHPAPHIHKLAQKLYLGETRRMKLEGYVASMGDRRDACRILMGKPEERRPLGKPRRKWEDNIKTYFRELE